MEPYQPTGIESGKTSNGFRCSPWFIAFQVAFCFGAIWLFVFHIPSMKRMFEEFGIVLPHLTVACQRLSKLGPMLLFLLFGVITAMGIGGHLFLANMSGSKAYSTIWVCLVTLTWVLFLFVVVFVNLTPLIAVWQGLSR